ncbi:MAG: HTH domain-containing protein [Nanoarchaeota archaeon]|nr:HTH domain-containing protein [Nanoarchaeota archaeon]
MNKKILKEEVLELLEKQFYSVSDLANKLKTSRTTVRRRLKEIEKSKIHIKRELPLKGKEIQYGYEPSLLERIKEEPFTPPTTDFDSPLEISINDTTNYGIACANTIFAGSHTNKNLFKNTLKYADAKNLDAMIITGNLIWMDLKRYSKYAPDRAENSQMDVDPRLINYPEAVKKAGKTPQAALENNKPVYITFKERLDTVIQKSLIPLFRSEDTKEPLYSGPIYITFGDMEEELVRQHTNEVIRMSTNREKEEIREIVSYLKTKLKSTEKEMKSYRKERAKYETAIAKEMENNKDNDSILETDSTMSPEPTEKQNDSESEDDSIEDQINDTLYDLEDLLEESESKRGTLLQEINDWKSYRSRVAMTQTHDSFKTLVSTHMRKYIIESLEKAIPNSKVISTGEAHIKINGKIGKIIPDVNKFSAKPSDTKMHQLKRKITADLHQGGEELDFVIAGGLSATYAIEPVVYQTSEGCKTIPLIQLPTCLDSKDCENSLNSKIRTGANKMAKLATHSDFQSGAIALRYIQGFQVTEQLREEFLNNEEIFSKKENITDYDLFYYAVIGDQHHGSRNISVTETKDSLDYSFNVAQDLLLELDAPLVAIFSLGDELQEKNYATESEGHPELLNPTQQKKFLEEILKIDDKSSREVELKRLTIRQAIRSGSLMPQEQLHDYMNNLRMELIEKTISRAEKVGYFGPNYLIINGNHNAHTTYGMYTTSQLIAREIRHRLGVTEEDVLMEEKIFQSVMAPMFGSEGLSSCLFGIAPNLDIKKAGILDQKALLKKALNQTEYYLYGMYARHKQSSTKNGDNLRGSRNTFNQRGQLFRITKDRNYVVLSAHDHMGGQSSSKRGLHQRSYCWQERNSYGESKDFGLPTIGCYVTGLPVGGFTSGPIVTVELPKEIIGKWAKTKPEVDTKKIFHNSITYKN